MTEHRIKFGVALDATVEVTPEDLLEYVDEDEDNSLDALIYRYLEDNFEGADLPTPGAGAARVWVTGFDETYLLSKNKTVVERAVRKRLKEWGV